VLAILGVIILAAILAGVAYAVYSYMNHPDTKLAKYDPDNING
jgi:multidrug resistance efflux pump